MLVGGAGQAARLMWTENPRVGGSIPPLAIRHPRTPLATLVEWPGLHVARARHL